jgi:hypothetical protein
MPIDHIRYDLLTQQALRGVIRTVLTDTIKGPRGDHHFKITFDTTEKGVRLAPRLRAQYPQEMTIILQHQFWDLIVEEDYFEVGLSFGGITERLRVPFDAIKGFADPSVGFELQFQPATAEEDVLAEGLDQKETAAPAKPADTQSHAPIPMTPANPGTSPDNPDKPTGGGEVVRLDRFRKK